MVLRKLQSSSRNTYWFRKSLHKGHKRSQFLTNSHAFYAF